MSFANRSNLVFSFTIWMTLISPSCLTALSRTFSTMLTRNRESGHPSLTPDFTGRLPVFTIEYGISCGFSTDALYQVWEGLFIYSLLSVFTMKKC